VQVSAVEYQRQAKQLSETTIVVVALWAVAIAFHPFRILRKERIVHFALQRDVRRSSNRERGKRGRVHCLEADPLCSSSLVTNSANTRAQKIDNVIMAAPPNRAHLR
jgi:hypothetical protein